MGYYPVDIDGEFTDLGQLSDGLRNERLQVARNKSLVIKCLCFERRDLPGGDKPLFLFPVRRDDRHYLRRKPEDRGAHHEDCPHYALSPDQLADRGLSVDALKDNDDGELRVNLDFGLTDTEDLDIPMARGQFIRRNGRTQQTRTRASLRGLLHLLWAGAGLNRYEPFRGMPALSPWERLRHEARRMIPNSMRSLNQHGLSSILLLPIDAFEDERIQSTRNYAKLKEAHKKRRVMFVCALRPEHVEGIEDDGYVLLKRTFGVDITVTINHLESAFRHFPAERAALHDGYFVIAFGVAKVREFERENGQKYFGATAERLALMGVTNWFVPVESSYERAVADRLEGDMRGYMKPLRYDADVLVHPDFVLTDIPGQYALEVYGMDTPEYLQRKAEKEAIYEERLPGRHWQWNVLHEELEEAMQRLPAATR